MGNKPIIQVALDLLELNRAVQIAKESVKGGADWIEAGTPLIKSEGMNAVRTLREIFPDKKIVADMKVADTGAIEVEMAAKSGANIINVLGNVDDATIEEAIRAANLYGVEIMVDLLAVKDPVERAKELESLGVHYLNVHAGIDEQMVGKTSVDILKEISKNVSIPIAVAGGLDAQTAAQSVKYGAKIVIVGGNITHSANVEESTVKIRRAIDEPKIEYEEEKTLDEKTRELLEKVSTSNISDAMHRKGAMSGVFPVNRGVKMVGRAVTVQTFAGDWAKPVEAIDIAGKGDAIVINNDGRKNIAPWGELATRSCMNKGISGVVIDGGVRDVDDIMKLNYPLFATATVPNAGEPKGFGEINAEITCCGQIVKPGDWIVGDTSGVVVIPRERGYEIARRAVEVKKNEERIREEIRRGSTLSQVVELYKWEKK